MRGRVRDVPLRSDPASRYLPWTVGLLVLLATLALAAGMFLWSAGETWRQNLSGTLTIQVPVSDVSDRRVRVDAASETLRSTPGILSIRPIPDAEIALLLEPWLGKQALGLELPVPDLIDATVASDADVDLVVLSARLEQAAPGAVVYKHATWLGRLTEFTRIAETVSYVVMIGILISAVTTVIYTTRTGLAVHRDIVEVLHLIGAQDSYVAWQFQTHTFRLASVGAAVGFILGAGIIWLAHVYGARLSGGLLPELAFGLLQWLLLAALPVGAVLLVVLTVGITVKRVLGKMM